MDRDNIKLIHGDCINVMRDLINKGVRVDLTVTSPPYDNLRTYNGTLEWNFEIFKQVAQCLYDITTDGGVVVWVIGDATIKGSETGTSFRQALYFKELGFNLHDTMIYQKSMPPLSHNRYEQNFEFMFVFSKGKPKTFNGIRVDRKYKDNRIRKGFGRNNDGSRDYGFSKDSDKVLKTNVWNIFAGGGSSDSIASKHPAIFPEQLANDHIISWSNEGDLVLDCFMGSGTTGKMALLNKRKFIGIEKVAEYFDIAKQRIDNIINDKQIELF